MRETLSHQSRFFNRDAIQLFKNLLQDLKDLRINGWETDDASVQIIAADRILYRTRRADDTDRLQQIFSR
jgi:hypothetical protein